MAAGGDAGTVSNPVGAYSGSMLRFATCHHLWSRRHFSVRCGGSNDRVDLSGIEGNSAGGVLVWRATGGAGNPDGGVAGNSGSSDGLEVTRAKIAVE